MTAVPIQGVARVSVTGDAVTVHGLTVRHPDTAVAVRHKLDEQGPDAATEFLAVAIIVGTATLTLGAASVDTGAMQRCLDGLAAQLDAKTRDAIVRLDDAVTRIAAGEHALHASATETLERLPDQIDRALGGQAVSVRDGILDAVRGAQLEALGEVRQALTSHADVLRSVLSTENPTGPIAALRRDVVTALADTRREMTDRLSQVHGLLQATDARRIALAKSSKEVGDSWEAQVVELMGHIAANAGDVFEHTGATPGPAGTGKSGDGLVTLSPAISGGADLRIVVEAKNRESRPLTLKAWRAELRAALRVRDAAAALAVVPTGSHVPAAGRVGRVDDLAFVVAADDPDLVTAVYLLLKELTLLSARRRTGGREDIDLGVIDAQIGLALAALGDFDAIGKNVANAQRQLESLQATANGIRERIRAHLRTGATALHR